MKSLVAFVRNRIYKIVTRVKATYINFCLWFLRQLYPIWSAVICVKKVHIRPPVEITDFDNSYWRQICVIVAFTHRRDGIRFVHLVPIIIELKPKFIVTRKMITVVTLQFRRYEYDHTLITWTLIRFLWTCIQNDFTFPKFTIILFEPWIHKMIICIYWLFNISSIGGGRLWTRWFVLGVLSPLFARCLYFMLLLYPSNFFHRNYLKLIWLPDNCSISSNSFQLLLMHLTVATEHFRSTCGIFLVVFDLLLVKQRVRSKVIFELHFFKRASYVLYNAIHLLHMAIKINLLQKLVEIRPILAGIFLMQCQLTSSKSSILQKQSELESWNVHYFM